MTHNQPNPHTPDPVADDCTERRLLRATHQLAHLLTEAMPLVEILNSTTTPHAYRAALREVVGEEQYFVLAARLHAMTSQYAWEAAYDSTYEAIPPEMLARMKALGVDITGL